jgi:hypothetical protein
VRLEFLAKLLAFGEVDQERLGQVGFGSSVGGPLELLVALVHVVEEILHPEERAASVSHHAVHLLTKSRPRSGSASGEAGGVEKWFKAKAVPTETPIRETQVLTPCLAELEEFFSMFVESRNLASTL